MRMLTSKCVMRLTFQGAFQRHETKNRRYVAIHPFLPGGSYARSSLEIWRQHCFMRSGDQGVRGPDAIGSSKSNGMSGAEANAGETMHTIVHVGRS